jgi:hypothetical protein
MPFDMLHELTGGSGTPTNAGVRGESPILRGPTGRSGGPSESENGARRPNLG